MIKEIIKQECRVQLRHPVRVMQLVLFLILATSMFIFALPLSFEQYKTISVPAVWVLLLFTLHLSHHYFFEEDFQDGTLMQMCLQPIYLPLLVGVKMLVWWCIYVLPLLLSLPIIMALLGTELGTRTLLSLSAASLSMLAVYVMVAAITLVTHKGRVLGFVLATPLLIPVIIFGANSTTQLTLQPLIGVVSLALFLVPLSIVVTSYVLKLIYR